MIYFFLFYIFLIPLEYIQYHEKLPKGPMGVNYQNITLAILMLWWLIGRMSKGKPIAMRTPLNWLLVGLIVYTYLGLLYSALAIPGAEWPFDPKSVHLKRFISFTNGLLIFYFAVNMLNSRRDIRRVMVAVALVTPFVFRVFYNQLGSVSTWHYNVHMRIKGPFVQSGSNELGAFFVYASLFMVVYAFARRDWRHRLFFLACTSLYAYGILYCYSRASQLAFLVGAGLIAFFKYRFLLVIFFVLFATSEMWLPVSVTDRWSMTKNESGELDESAQSRKNYWAIT